jgi:hypothetical protein
MNRPTSLFILVKTFSNNFCQKRTLVEKQDEKRVRSGTWANFYLELRFLLPILIPPTATYLLIILSSTLYSLGTETVVKQWNYKRINKLKNDEEINSFDHVIISTILRTVLSWRNGSVLNAVRTSVIRKKLIKKLPESSFLVCLLACYRVHRGLHFKGKLKTKIDMLLVFLEQ